MSSRMKNHHLSPPAWNMSTFVTRRSDTCYKAVCVIWLKPGLSDRNNVRLVAINEVCKSNSLFSDRSDVYQTPG